MELTNNTMSNPLSQSLDIVFEGPYLHGNIIKEGSDCLQGAFTDYYLPVPEALQASQTFYRNTEILSLNNNKMTLLQLPQLLNTYATDIYGIDRVNGVLYVVYPQGMKKLEIRERVNREETPQLF